MNNSFTTAEELIGHLKEYAANRADAAKLSIAEKTSKVMSYLITVVAVLLFFLCFIAFTSIALAYLLGSLTGKVYLGFLIIAVCYLALGAALWFSREKLLRYPIMNAILRQLHHEKDNETV